MKPTAAIAETFPRNGMTNASLAALTLGQASFWAVHLYAGESITSITFFSSSTPGAAMTNQWFVLASTAGAPLRFTADDTSTAWSANAKKTLSLTSAYVIPSDGIYLIGAMVAGSTAPTLAGASNNATILGEAPALSFRDTTHTGLTNVASAPGTFTLSGLSTEAYGYCS